MPNELEKFPHEELHSLTYNTNDPTYMPLYCKCQTSSIGIAHSFTEIEEIFNQHNRRGIICGGIIKPPVIS